MGIDRIGKNGPPVTVPEVAGPAGSHATGPAFQVPAPTAATPAAATSTSVDPTRAAGTALELSRVRGASQADRASLARSAAAVLDRDPIAAGMVRTELTSRRDAAATALSFEFAARLQAEIVALDWVAATQKVTSPEPADYDVCGWADGMLVRFEVRGGRLTSWTQRRCPEAELTDGTPPEWAAFAGRNARLAAVLAR